MAQQYKDKLNPQSLIQENFVLLPHDIGELDQASMKYLLRYGLTEDEISRAGIGYSPSYQRMIIPVYNEIGQCIMWQGRYFGDKPKMPKHLTVGVEDRAHIFYYETQGARKYPRLLVLVESALSAIKVGRVAPCMGLLGSVLPKQSQAATAHFMGAYSSVILWLDPDKWLASTKMATRLRELYGVPATSLLTNHKPKEYDTRVIEQLLLDHIYEPDKG
jgi:hypothetical protein